jgi:hypothetical protein
MTFSQWLLVGGIAVLVLLILGGVAFVRLRQRNPEGAAKVQAAVSAGATEVWSDTQTIGHTIAFAVDSAVDKIIAARAAAGAHASSAPAIQIEHGLGPITEAMPISGRNGQAGTFTITVQVVGDPKLDVPTINAKVAEQYFA